MLEGLTIKTIVAIERANKQIEIKNRIKINNGYNLLNFIVCFQENTNKGITRKSTDNNPKTVPLKDIPVIRDITLKIINDIIETAISQYFLNSFFILPHLIFWIIPLTYNFINIKSYISLNTNYKIYSCSK